MTLADSRTALPPLPRPAAEVRRPVPPDVAVEHMTLAEALREQAAWRRLLDAAVDDNPFLSPAVIEPAARHLTEDGALSVAMIWRSAGRGRKLAGLAVLANRRLRYAGALVGGNDAALFAHPLIPLGGILLAEPPELASAGFRKLTQWLGNQRPRPKAVTLPRIETASLLASLITTDAIATGAVLRRRPEMRHSHGFDIPSLSIPHGVEDVGIMQGPRDISATLERLLTFDAWDTEHGAGNPMLVADPRMSGFIRSAVRGLAQEGRIHLAMLDSPAGQAGAIAVLGRSRAYLWWVMGPSGRDPLVQATLAAALTRSTGLPLISAAAQPLTGFGTQPLITETFSLGLEPAVGGLVRRMRERMLRR